MSIEARGHDSGLQLNLTLDINTEFVETARGREPSADLQEAVWALSGCVCPISVAEEGSGGRRFRGSAVLISFGLHRIVVTAAHVVAGPETKYLGLSQAGSVIWPTAYARVSPLDTRTRDPDIAFAFLTVAAGTQGALPESLPFALLLPDHSLPEGASMVALGYPASRARATDAQTLLRADLMSVVGDLAPAGAATSDGGPPDARLAMSFRRDAFVDDHGAAVVAADPHGMSGGALFLAATRTDADGHTQFAPRLVGILTEHHADPTNVLVASRIECLLDALGVRREGAATRFCAIDV